MAAGEFGARFAEALPAAVAATRAVGVKTVAAYRVGLDLSPDRPTSAEVTAAAAAWLRRGPGDTRRDASGDAGGNASGNGVGPRWRLDDPVLTRLMLWPAVELGLPIQVHVGFGDSDIRMHRVDPSLLTDWLHRHRTPVMLLHCWPYQRQAGYLAAVYPHVYLDVGLTLTYVGPTRAAAVLEEATEIAPFGKLLYSSDAFGVAELHQLGALTFRRALAGLLDARVAEGEWAASDAVRIAQWMARDNAARVYQLG